MRHPWGFIAVCLVTIAVLAPTTPLSAFTHSETPSLVAVGETPGVPSERFYVNAQAVDELELVALRKTLIENGAQKVNLFLPQKIIVCDVPETMEKVHVTTTVQFQMSRMMKERLNEGVEV